MINIQKSVHNLGISPVNIYKNHSDVREEKDIIEVDFGPTPDILEEEYIHVYVGIQ